MSSSQPDEVSKEGQAEEALRESAAQLQPLLDHSSAIMFIKDLEGRYLFVNRQFDKLRRTDAGSVLGRTDLDIFPPEQAAAFMANDRKVLQDLRSATFEEVAQHNDGLHANLACKFPLFDASGRPYAVGGIVTDITDRKRTEEVLRLSVENLHLATGAARVGMWFWDLRTDNLEWTSICKALFGLPADQVMTYEVFLKAVHPDDRERTDLAVRRSLSTRSPYRMEYRTVWPDASEHWLMALGQGCYDKQGQPIRMVGVVLDITERKRAEDALTLYKQIIAHSSEAIAILDLQGRYLEQNDAHRLLAGHADGELCGHTPEIHLGAEAFAAIFRDLTSTGVHRGEYEGRTKDGDTLILDLSVFAVCNSAGEPMCYVEIERDMTKRKSMEQQLRQTEKMAAMGMLIAGVSHEINNPLFALSGYIELASERVRSGEHEGLAEDIAAMREAVERATAMVRRFLSVAHSSVRHREPCAVNAVVEQGLELVSNDCLIHGISISRNLASDLPLLEADSQELLHVLLNLFTNARQAMITRGYGTLSVTTSLAASPRHSVLPPVSSDAWIEIRVQDDGPGIAPEHLGRVFEPFFTTKPVGEGTGLGLSMSHRIVMEHGGTLTCRSNAGHGATFMILLPVGRSDQQEAEH